MRKVKTAIAFLVFLCTLGFLVPVQAANILIVAGSDALAQAAAGTLNTLLSGTNTVTVVNASVPASLSGYTQIYDTRYGNSPAFTVAEQTQYVGFLNATPGNTVFLMGENSGFTSRNQPISDFIALAGGGTIAVPLTNNMAPGYTPENVNAPFNTTPNALSSVTFAACGVVTSSGTGAFATTEPGGTSGCSLYFNRGTLANALGGALVVVYDVNFLASAPSGSGAANEVAFAQNLTHFVATGGAPSTTPISIPTLTQWGVLILTAALALGGLLVMRRKQR